MKKLALVSFFLIFIIYLIASPGNTPHDYFTRLSHSFLQNKYWLEENPSWLSELIPAKNNIFYVVYPPMPAILLMPFVFIFGKSFPQQYLAHFLGALLVVLTMKLSYLLKKDKRLTLWSGALVGIGSIIFYMSSVGSVWYLGQITAAFFLTAALIESLDKKRLLLVSIFLGAAYLSRPHTILSLPLYIFLIRKNLLNKKSYLKFIIPFLIFLAFDSTYNFVRFGVPWNKGYFLIPGTLSEPWFSKGIVHLSYIFEDLKVAFLMGPKFLSHFPYIQPSWAGMAIWITTPAFIFALKAPLKEMVVKLSWLSIFLIFLVVGVHGGTGFAQFGYRFAVDFYPFLIFLTIKGVVKTKPKSIHWVLLLMGILVNLWGVLWINKFGWVSY
ncbi:MAG: hypothetical protein WBD86_02430 [Microgenomates group bacterium]